MRYYTIVNCNDKQRRLFGRKLRRYGLSFDGFQYSGILSKSSYNRLHSYCVANHIRIRIDNGYGDRGTNYRQTYFKANKPFYKDLYCCAYCGRIMRRRDITIDHIYPINQVRSSIKLQNFLKFHGIKNVNDEKNLTPACPSCNKHKSDKMGLWIIRGKIGKYQRLWRIRWAIRIVTIIVLVAFACAKGGIL